MTVTGQQVCSGPGAASVTYTGYVQSPGCNFAYGNWTNYKGNSGGFGVDNPYPNEPAGTFTKPVDVPTSESSVTPTGTQWSTANSAP